MNTISNSSARISFQAPPQRAASADNQNSSTAAADSFSFSTLGSGGWGSTPGTGGWGSTPGSGGWGNPPAPPEQQPPAQQPPAQQPPAQQPPAQQPPSEQPPAEQPPQTPAKKWTVMVYSASDNNLYSLMQDDLDEAERIGTTDSMNIIAQTDHAPAGGGGQRLELQTNQEPGLQSPVKEEMGDIDMGKAETLADFIKWGVKNYPAENYMVIISDHGGGWTGAASDDSQGGWMTTPQLEQGLSMARAETGRKIDVLGFDACLMASAEVAHQLKDEANYLVASEETEGGAGWQYNRVFSERVLGDIDSALRTRLNVTPEELATRVVSMADGNQNDLPTMAAIDLTKAADVTAAVSNFANAAIASNVSLSDAANNSQTFSGYTDLVDFANNAQAAAGQDANLAAAAQGVKDAVAAATVAESHSADYPGAHGLTVELSSWSAAGDGYGQLKFAQETPWAQAVAKISG